MNLLFLVRWNIYFESNEHLPSTTTYFILEVIDS
jgi:hypothetical protein